MFLMMMVDVFSMISLNRYEIRRYAMDGVYVVMSGKIVVNAHLDCMHDIVSMLLSSV